MGSRPSVLGMVPTGTCAGYIQVFWREHDGDPLRWGRSARSARRLDAYAGIASIEVLAGFSSRSHRSREEDESGQSSALACGKRIADLRTHRNSTRALSVPRSGVEGSSFWISVAHFLAR